MLGIFITLFTFVLVLISLFMGLVILMQRSSTQGGLGAAFGGGVADSAFGAETTNVLTRATKWSGIAFFVVASALYLMHIANHSEVESEEVLPDIAPVATETATEATAEETEATAPLTATDVEAAVDGAVQAAQDAATEEVPADEEPTEGGN
jgi:preprotein translocase subunit SecG